MKKSVKKILTGTICTSVAVALIGAGAILTSAKFAEKQSIGSDAALTAAINNAGLKKEDVLRTESDFERQNGNYVYEIEFDSDGKEYDYVIDAKSGSVISKKIGTADSNDIPTKVEPTTVAKTESAAEKSTASAVTEKTTQSTSKSASLISTDTAKAKALADANVSADKATFIKAEKDYDNGKVIYDIEFLTQSKKYEYEIDAATGAVVEKEIENRTAKTTAATTTKSTVTTTKAAVTSESAKSELISVDRAKEIALNHASLKASDVRFVKAKLDKDDGIYEYEISFIKGIYEYDYEINAKSGAIIDFEKELID